jgi:hypothetical protein
MAKGKDDKVTRRILRGVTFQVRGSSRTFVPGEEDDLEKYMTAEQAEKLIEAEAIEGDWNATGEPAGQDVMTYSPAALGKTRGNKGNRSAPAWAREPEKGPASAPAARGQPAATARPADYDQMTLEELHAEAAKREIPGRSGLDKAGLVKALQKK